MRLVHVLLRVLCVIVNELVLGLAARKAAGDSCWAQLDRIREEAIQEELRYFNEHVWTGIPVEEALNDKDAKLVGVPRGALVAARRARPGGERPEGLLGCAGHSRRPALPPPA